MARREASGPARTRTTHDLAPVPQLRRATPDRRPATGQGVPAVNRPRTGPTSLHDQPGEASQPATGRDLPAPPGARDSPRPAGPTQDQHTRRRPGAAGGGPGWVGPAVEPAADHPPAAAGLSRPAGVARDPRNPLP